MIVCILKYIFKDYCMIFDNIILKEQNAKQLQKNANLYIYTHIKYNIYLYITIYLFVCSNLPKQWLYPDGEIDDDL